MPNDPSQKTCPRCQGNGVCHDCQGSGHVNCPACSGAGHTVFHGKEIACRTCQGSGQIDCPPQCPSCGGSGVITSQFQEDQQRKYQPATQGMRPAQAGTVTIIVICLILYALAPPDLPAVVPQPWPFLIWKALVSSPGVWSNGEYWRLISPAFLHGNFWHLGFNMYALWMFGPAVETVLGTPRYIALYVTSALGGCVLSSLLNVCGGIGASGAIFGVGAALIVLNRRWGVFPTSYANSLRNTLIAIIVIGFMMGGVFGFQLDNWGHIGGALAGLVFARSLRKI